MNKKIPTGVACASALMMVIAGCGTDSSEPAAAKKDGAGKITVTNCGQELTVDKPISKMFVNDGNIISIALAAGAHDQITAVSSLQRDEDVVALAFGKDATSDLKVAAKEYPSLENVLAAQPDLMFAGWGYGFTESKNMTPEVLKEKGIPSYLLSETCRQEGGARGTMNPWEALTHDITSIGALTGNVDTAAQSVGEIEARREALEKAPKPKEKPTAFLVDSPSDTILSCGSFGAPQAIFDSAGVTNALEDVEDTWTQVSWERLATADPDIMYFVEYPGMSYADKIAALQANPATKNLAAVKEKRFVNLPYAMWTSGPLNIDAAEYVRKSLEHYGLAPKSNITTKLDIAKLSDLPGNEWLATAKS